jgi:hypothetical protein
MLIWIFFSLCLNLTEAISEPYEQRPEDSEPKSDTTELQNSTKIEGTCMDMCPYEERIERMNTRRLDFFEMVHLPFFTCSLLLIIKKQNSNFQEQFEFE